MSDFAGYENPETTLRRWAVSPKLQRARGTVFHKLRAAARPNNQASRPDVPDDYMQFMGSLVEHGDFQIFIVEHDWAAAFKNADQLDVDLTGVKLPYPLSIFEFVISGRRVCVAARQNEGDPELFAFVQLPFAWSHLSLASPHMISVNAMVRDQLRAIAIALDARIAVTEVVRAPFRLNRTRERAKKAPISAYHVVKLARRDRPDPLPESAPTTRAGVRLHFRRGHWRHFETHKTWINWTLVGDPDLGFIDKHYRL